MSANEICARCSYFSLKDSPQAAEGIGRCLGYGAINPEPFVRWDHRPTILYTPERDRQLRDKREQWISQRRRAEEAGNVAAASPQASHDTQTVE